MGKKLNQFLANNKLSKREAKQLSDKALNRAVSRIEASPDLRIGGGAQKYVSNRTGNSVSTGSNTQAGANAGGGKSSSNVPDWRQSDLGQFARTADMYGMGTKDQGVFSGASYNQMKAAGYSDDQITGLLNQYEGSDLMRGNRVQKLLDNYESYMMPTAPDMPGMTDPRSGDEIGSSRASRPDIFFMPVNTEGVNNMFGNPLGNGIVNSSVVGDGIDFQDSANAGELARYNNPFATSAALDGMYAMSSANPNLQRNMNAFIDSGHRESLLTGKTPTGDPKGWNETFPSALGGLTPWSQAYNAQINYASPWAKKK